MPLTSGILQVVSQLLLVVLVDPRGVDCCREVEEATRISQNIDDHVGLLLLQVGSGVLARHDDLDCLRSDHDVRVFLLENHVESVSLSGVQLIVGVDDILLSGVVESNEVGEFKPRD